MRLYLFALGLALTVLVIDALTASEAAADTRLVTLNASHHHNSDEIWNEVHYGIGIETERLLGVLYRNSYDENTALLALRHSFYSPNPDIEASFAWGTAMGYFDGAIPVLMFTLRAGPLQIYTVPGVVTALGLSIPLE